MASHDQQLTEVIRHSIAWRGVGRTEGPELFPPAGLLRYHTTRSNKSPANEGWKEGSHPKLADRASSTS